jgi:lipid A export permease/ATP-binding protein msbA
VLCNLLGAFFSLFSLSFIIPFLGVLFGTMPLVYERPEFTLDLDGVQQVLYYYITQVILTHGKEVALLFVMLFVLLNALLKNFFVYAALWHLSPIRVGIVRDIRNVLYSKILYLPLGYYTEEHKGDIISRMTNDVNEIENSIVRSLEMLLRDPLLILVHFAGLLFISPRLTLFVFLFLPVSGGLIGLVGKNLRRQSTHMQELLAQLLSSIDETLQGLRIVKAFNAEKRTAKHFQTDNQNYSRLTIHVNRKRDLASPLSEFLGTLIVGVVLWYGGSLVLGEEQMIAPEALIGFMALFYMILNPAKSFVSAYFNLIKGLASVDRVQEILDQENPIKSPSQPRILERFKERIEFRDVSFSYGDKMVICHLNLTIEKGMTVALVGHSGAGKTTLADLLPRFYDVTGGSILLDGHDIREYSVTALRGLMGNVNQEPILFNDTIYNNIAFGVEHTTQEEVERAARIANAHEFIVQTPDGYQSNIGDRGSKLSGGQRQRLSIARAILKNPPIMILDEATSALDTESERLVQQALVNLMANRTSLVIAHRLSTIKHADLICVLNKGQIIEQGTHDELLALNGEYSKLYSLQSW